MAAIKRRGEEGWGFNGEGEDGGKGMPASNRLGDHKGRHFTEGVALKAPAQVAPGGEKEPGERG